MQIRHFRFMKFGLYFENAQHQKDWLRESDMKISVWDSIKEADNWRKNHTVNPNKYIVKEVTKKILLEDANETNSTKRFQSNTENMC